MVEFNFRFPNLSPLVDDSLREKLLGDIPSLEELVSTPSFGYPSGSSRQVVEEEQENEEEEE